MTDRSAPELPAPDIDWRPLRPPKPRPWLPPTSWRLIDLYALDALEAEERAASAESDNRIYRELIAQLMTVDLIKTKRIRRLLDTIRAQQSKPKA